MDTIDRREAVRRISAALGAAVSAPTLAGLLAGCEVPRSRDAYLPRTLVGGRLRTVELAAEAILPTTDTPGASAARVHEFIDWMLTDFYPEEVRARFMDGLRDLDARSQQLFGADFASGTDDQRNQVLTAIDAEAYPDPDREPEAYSEVERRVAQGQPPFMRTLKELVVSGYYTSEIGQTVELHIAPFGPFEADVPLDSIGRTWA